MTTATPRYQQLKDRIIDRIARGQLSPGDRVPSENELAAADGVSRMTANRALKELTAEGYVERVAGSGTFVAEPTARSDALAVRNIADEVELRGHAYSASVLTLERLRADRAVARALNLRSQSIVFHAQVVHRENDLPIQLEDRYVSRDFAPAFLQQDFHRQTPSAYLTGIAPLQDAEHVLRAEMPPAWVRKALQMPAQEPCLVINRRTFTGSRPVTWGRLYHPGSRFELTGRYTPPANRGPAKPNATRNAKHEPKRHP